MKIIILYLLTCLIWGSTWLAIKFQITNINIELSLTLRFFIAFIFLYLFCIYKNISLKIGLKNHILISIIGVLLFALQYRLIYESEKEVTSGLVAVISTSIVFFNLFFSQIFLKVRPKSELVLGSIIGVSGMTLIFYQDILKNTYNLGVLLAITACIFASLGSILSEKVQKDPLIGPFQITLFGILYAGIFSLIFTLTNGQEINFDLKKEYIISLIYLSIFGSVFAFTSFIYLIDKLGSTKASYITLFYPIVALIISYFYEDFEWTYQTSIGILLIATGKLVSLNKMNFNFILNKEILK